MSPAFQLGDETLVLQQPRNGRKTDDRADGLGGVRLIEGLCVDAVRGQIEDGDHETFPDAVGLVLGAHVEKFVEPVGVIAQHCPQRIDLRAVATELW